MYICSKMLSLIFFSSQYLIEKFFSNKYFYFNNFQRTVTKKTHIMIYLKYDFIMRMIKIYL